MSARVARSNVPFAVIAVASGLVLFYLGRSMTFDNDEWRSVTFDGGLVDYLRPVNEHWSTFPLLLYRVTFGVFELRSHLPYQAELVALHLLAVAGAYALMRARIGSLPATLVALPLLLLGSGAENLYWAFQTGFIGSVMFGVWALVFLEWPRREAPLIASLFLFASLASSGIGLFFLVAAFGRAIVDPSLRRRAVVAVAPAVAFLLWFGLFGRDAVGVNGPVGVDLAAASFAVRGLIYSAEHASGFDHLPDGHVWGLVLLVGLAAMTVVRLVHGQRAGLAAGCLLGLVAMYAVIACARADLGREYGTESRYVYVAAFLLALVTVDLLRERDGGRARSRGGVTLSLALLLGLGFVTWANIDDLVDKRSRFQFKADVNRAFIGLALTRGAEHWVDRDATVGYMPPLPVLVPTIERHGSPLHDEYFPEVVVDPGNAAREVALLVMVGDGFRIEPSSLDSGLVRSQIHIAQDASVRDAGDCVKSTTDTEVWIMRVPAAARVRVRSSAQLALRVDLAHEGGPPRQIYSDLTPDVPRDVVVPDIGDGRPWVVGLASRGSAAPVQLCLLRRARESHSARLDNDRSTVSEVRQGSPAPGLRSVRD